MWPQSLQGAPGNSAARLVRCRSLSASCCVPAIQTLSYQQAWLGVKREGG